MTDSEKRNIIIGEFERFIQDYDQDIGFATHDKEVLMDALALLQAQEPAYVEERLVLDKLHNIQEYARVNEINWMADGAAFAETVIGALQGRISALLKTQEPRVMTLEEVKMLDRDYYYLEAMRSPGKELREIVGAYGLTCVTWPSITWARQTMGDGGYGKTWRCWTSRPTDEQRKAVKWE